MSVVRATKTDVRRGRVLVAVDGSPPLKVPLALMADFGLRVGQEVSPEQAEALREASDRWEAREVALRLLGHRARSREELRQRLARRGYHSRICEEVLNRLQEVGLVDDLAFAREWTRSKLARGPVGLLALRAGLRRFALAHDVVEQVLAEEYEPQARHEDLVLDVRKKWEQLRNLDRAKAYRRLGEYLARRGFDRAQIEDVVEEVVGDDG